MLLSENGLLLLMMMAGDVADEEVAGAVEKTITPDHDHPWMNR